MRLFSPFCLLLLVGCSGTPALRPHVEDDIAQQLRKSGYAIDVQTTDHLLTQGEPVRDASGMIANGQLAAQSMQTAAQNSPGGGASAVGLVLGTLLINQYREARLQERARKSNDHLVAPLRQATTEQALSDWFVQTLSDKLNAGDLARPPGTENSPYVLLFTPQSQLSRDVKSTRLITEVRVTFGHQPLYQGRIEVLSNPADTNDMQHWIENDGEAYKKAMQANIEEMLRVLALDLDTRHFASLHNRETTLRYTVGDSRIIERGRIVDEQGQRVVFMDLHGWLKSIPLQTEP
ncbi:hypothetical protein [Pseudomonas indica]|uniref:hypothetical protein n=1 Tax=Pseudomonas indica TaxID=137658 RepID=UPI000BAC08E4|nr:hypothetical protein [Pseudomonas indica]